MDMIRVGPALPGSVPFERKPDGSLVFNGQNGRQCIYGHAFDRERGYRVFFRFADSTATNTWGGESLLAWSEFKATDAEQANLQKVARRLAHQVIRMNRHWERLGRPASGIPSEPQGNA